MKCEEVIHICLFCFCYDFIHLNQIPHFMLDALVGTTLPIYPGLGQAPNMLACIPGGLVIPV